MRLALVGFMSVCAGLPSPDTVAADPKPKPESLLETPRVKDARAKSVCCKKGRHLFASTLTACNAQGGYVPGGRLVCYHDDAQVCCRKGPLIKRATWRACRLADGDAVSPGFCSP
jgi:hypothetical protein